MKASLLRRLDAFSQALLLLWGGMALGFLALGMSGSLSALRRLDWAAWAAFLLPLALSWGSRWLAEFQEKDGIGPLRLWSAAALAALLMCFASTFLVTPRMASLRARVDGPVENLPGDHPDRAAFQRAHGVSTQMLVLRMLLALGLAAGVAFLPRTRED